jgi:hypothetical protein
LAVISFHRDLLIVLLLFTGVFSVNAQILPDSTATIKGVDVKSGNDSLSMRLRKYSVDNFASQFQKPTFWQMFRYIPDDLYQFGKFTVQKENLGLDAVVLGSTLVLIPLDQALEEDAIVLGHKLGGGWDKDSQYKDILGLNIVPQNISSGVYYIGNGGTTLLLSGVFYGIGKIGADDYRALNTSSELIECLFSVGITTQVLKRITGRQTPVRALPAGNDGGAWQPFPSFSDYQQNTPNYDAMPSGHIATYMATLTIIAINYPELKWIRPVGYTVMAVLAFNMVSTGVHWVSDYPIGIFIGYVIGKTIAERRLPKIQDDQPPGKPKIKVSYHMSQMNQTNLFGAAITF